MITGLYVPADQPRRVAKALASHADVVLIDLEDALAPAAKPVARARLPELLDGVSRPVQVRINAMGGPWFEQDAAMVADLPPGVQIRVPKVGRPDQVRDLAQRLGRGLHILIESALGVENAGEIAAADPAVQSIGLGEADLRAELGMAEESGLAWVRSRIVVAAAAANLAPPWMSVYPHLRDPAGLARSCAAGRALGFQGRAAIHPDQLPVIAQAFRPTEQELAQAQQLVDRVAGSIADGSGTVVLDDGSFADIAMVRAARRMLELGNRPLG
ncbi:MAG: HpcH/HpaI aldolase/citrate lyase family protein [Beutenbergiaceae bacterium]